VHSIGESILASKLKLKAQQIDALSESVIQVTPSQKGSLHDGILKLKTDLLNVVIRVDQNNLCSRVHC
jgi:hypothetical protein